jgi:hypothetical protein
MSVERIVDHAHDDIVEAVFQMNLMPSDPKVARLFFARVHAIRVKRFRQATERQHDQLAAEYRRALSHERGRFWRRVRERSSC